ARRLEQEMEMVPHDDVTEQLPAVADDGVFEAVDEPASVGVVAHDFLAGIAPRHDVVNGVLKFDSQSPRPRPMLAVVKPGVKPKPLPKSDTVPPLGVAIDERREESSRGAATLH